MNKDAAKEKSGMKVWHGTDRATPPTHGDIYFAEEKDDAHEYGSNLFSATISPKRLLKPTEVHMLRKVLMPVLLDQKGLDVPDLVGNYGVHYPYLRDYPEVHKLIREQGYDGVFVDEPMSSNGQSILILNPKVVKWDGHKDAAVQPVGPVYFYIEVPRWARGHFWEEPPEGNLEFWAFKDRPRCFYNQKIIFKFDGQPVAEAKVLKIEEPGHSKCENTGKYEKHWKVFWNPTDFKKYKIAGLFKQADTDIRIGEDFNDIYGNVIPYSELEDWLATYSVFEAEPLLQILNGHNKIATLEGLEVEPENQGRGYGKELLKGFIAEAQQLGASAIVTVVDTGGKQRPGFNLVEWYKHQGFETANIDSLFPIMYRILGPAKVAKEAARRTTKPKAVPMPKVVTDDGFVTPDGKWLDCGRQDHDTVAMELGYKGKEEPRYQAIRDGYVRVVVWLEQESAFMMFRDAADAQRRAGEILRHFPVTTQYVGIETGRGNYHEYELAEAEEKYPSGTLKMGALNLPRVMKKWNRPTKELDALRNTYLDREGSSKQNAIAYGALAVEVFSEFKKDIAPFVSNQQMFPSLEMTFAQSSYEKLEEALYTIRRNVNALKHSVGNEWELCDQIEREIEKALHAKGTILHALQIGIPKSGAERSLWYHGTSLNNLRSILKQGLITDPKEKVWNDDPDASTLGPSRESYGGIYITTNLMTAISSVKDKRETGGMCIVCAEMQPNTMYLDEDDLKSTLTPAIGHLSENSFHVLCYYLAASHERVPDEWRQEIEKSQKQFADDAIAQWKYRMKQQGKEMHADLEKQLRDSMPEIWFASLERLAGHMAKNAKDYDLMRAYSQVFNAENYDYEQVKSQIRQFFPSVEQGEKHFMRVVEPLTRTLRQMATTEHFNPTARVTEDITYSGSNRIVAVVEILYPKSGSSSKSDPYVFKVRWGSLPQDFLKQWEERMGGKYVIEKGLSATAGLGDSDDVEMPNPLQVTPGRPDVIEDWKYLPEQERQQTIKDAEVMMIDPHDLKTNQETIDRKGFEHFAQNPQKINSEAGGLSGEHQKHPLVLDTNEGMYLYDGNHRCAAALSLDMEVKVLYIDLRPMEGLMNGK